MKLTIKDITELLKTDETEFLNAIRDVQEYVDAIAVVSHEGY